MPGGRRRCDAEGMTAVIEVQHLHKSYGDTVAVDDVSFTVEEGEIFGILGPNGAGKTTTVECVEGLRTPDRGDDQRARAGPAPGPGRADPAARRAAAGQPAARPAAGRPRRWSCTARSTATPADWRELMERARPGRQAAGPGSAKLSGGQKQRLSIALALVGSPRVAVLDELTTGLDPQARRDTWELIEDVRARGVTIVLVTHFMEEAERLCDRVALIDAGRVVAVDTPAGAGRAGSRPSSGSSSARRCRWTTRLLTSLPEVTSVTRRGDVVVVTGNGNALNAVTSALARHQIVAQQLRVEQASLEDAFVALTGQHHDDHRTSDPILTARSRRAMSVTAVTATAVRRSAADPRG